MLKQGSAALLAGVCVLLLAGCDEDPWEGPTCPGCPSTRVIRVIDGDTLETGEGLVRLYGVDTPEREEKCYSEAAERTRELAGRFVRLENGPREHDEGGRRLAYVYTNSGRSIDAALVDEGLGTAWRFDGQHVEELAALERRADHDHEGCLWDRSSVD